MGDLLRIANLAHRVLVESVCWRSVPPAEIVFTHVVADTAAFAVRLAPAFGANPSEKQAPILWRRVDRLPLSYTHTNPSSIINSIGTRSSRSNSRAWMHIIFWI